MSVITSSMVDSMSRKGDAIKVDDKWFKAWDAEKAGLNKVNRGDTVSFTYKTVEKPSGTYYNIQGLVEVESRGSGGGGSVSTSPSTRSFSVKGFPIGPLDSQRAIIRQNCLSHATRVVIDGEVDKVADTTDAANEIIRIARLFESYASGDLDYEEAKAMAAAALGSKEVTPKIPSLSEDPADEF